MTYLIALAFSPFTNDVFMLIKLLVISAGLIFTKTVWRNEPINYLGLGLIGCSILTAYTSGLHSLNLIGNYNSYFCGTLTLVLIWLGYCSIVERERLINSIIWSAAICGLICVLQQFGPSQFQQNHRSIGTIGNPTFCATLLTLGFGLTGPTIPGLLILLGIMATKTRGAYLAITAIFLYKNKSILNPKRILLISALLIAGLISYSQLMHKSESDFGRLETYRIALKAWTHHPIIGCGSEAFYVHFRNLRSAEFVKQFGKRTLQDYAHNDIIHVLYSWGIIGIAIYLSLLRYLWKQASDIRLQSAIIGVFICAKFNAVPIVTLFLLAQLCSTFSKTDPESDSIFSVFYKHFIFLLKVALFVFTCKLFIADLFFFNSFYLKEPKKQRMMYIATKINPYEPFYRNTYSLSYGSK